MTYQDLLIQNRQQSQQLEEKSQLIDTLQFEIANLKKLIFGARRERFTGNADAATQSTLFDIEASPNIEQPETVTKTIIIKKRKKPKTFKRKSFPAHLPREEKTIQPEDIKADAAAYTKIGESITELLKYHPAHLTVKKIIRPKYIMKNDEDAGVKQALVPPRLIPGGIVDESLIAGLITEKILHHTPVHRFNKKLGAEALLVLQEQIKKDMLSQNYNQVDETTITVLAKNKKNASHRGYMWVLYNPKQQSVLFNYHPTRSKIAAQQLLGTDYEGVLQADGYNVYPSLAKNKLIQLIFCMAHARRKFIEAQNNDPSKASYVLEKMQQLYQIERKARTKQLDEPARLALRQSKALPILNELGKWLKDEYTSGKVLPKSAIGKAIAYSLERWQGLCTYAYNGALEIDNNLVENTIRPIALGRKNYLFAGSHDAAANLACLYTIVGTAKQHNLNVQKYLTWLFKKIASEKMTDANIKSCLPYNLSPEDTEVLRL